jgi:signal transduction histidine kinase
MRTTRSTTIMKSGWMTLAVIVLLAAIISLNWYFYIRIRENLDEEFGLRLQAIANHIASSIDERELALLRTVEDDPSASNAVASTFIRYSDAYSLSNIALIREDGVTLLSLKPDLYRPGELYLYWQMDYEGIISALGGVPAATDLYRTPDGDYMKAGYAPVRTGTAAPDVVVAVEASVDFLKSLRELRAVLYTATAISVIGIALFTWFVLKATQSLMQARESLLHSESLATMGRMAAGIAHEIRNPLFIIQSSAERLRRMHPEDSRDINTFIIEEVSRLDGILRDYLLIARNEPAPKMPLDLAVTLRRSVRLMEESLQETDIRLVTDIAVHEAPFTGEEKRLQQSFINILLNAQQALGSSGTMRVAMATIGNSYRIVIEDDGPGIIEKDLINVFEPFYTTKPAGSGLGLAIVKKVIDDHGGTIEIVSTSATGTKVTVTLPINNRATAPGKARQGETDK